MIKDKEFEKDYEAIGEIMNHIKQHLQGLNGYKPKDEPIEFALRVCLTNLDRAKMVMFKSCNFTTGNYSAFPKTWCYDRVAKGESWEGFSWDDDED